MKKLITMLLAITMAFSLVACSKTEPNPTQTETTQTQREYDHNDPDAVLGEIENDFDDTIIQMKNSMYDTVEKVGSTYSEYKENKGLVKEWSNSIMTESNALFDRTKENSIAYFKLIANHEDKKYSEFITDALSEYYETMIDVFDEYYDEIYYDLMEDFYDVYYNGLVEDAEGEIPDEEWDEAYDEAYTMYDNLKRETNFIGLDKRDYFTSLMYDVKDAFNSNNYDVDAIVTQFDENLVAEKEAKLLKEYGGVKYTINSDGFAEVVGYVGTSTYVTIKSEYEGKLVVKIADSAFENCDFIKDFIIWADIKEIGDSAFKGCTGISDFNIKASTTSIGRHAFEGCTQLTDVYTWGSPDIGEYCFAGCTSLTDINISSATKNIGAHAFENCTALTEIFFWGGDETIIGDYAFAGCTALEDLSIPYGVLSVGHHAFDGCTALADVSLYSYDTAIGVDAFANCPNLNNAPEPRGTVLECTNK